MDPSRINLELDALFIMQEQANEAEPETVRFGQRTFIYDKDIAALTDKDVVSPIQKAVTYVTTTFSKALRERSEQLHQRTIEGKRMTSIVNDLGKLSQEVKKNTSHAFNLRDYIPLLASPGNIATAIKDMMLLDTQFLLLEEKRKELLTILASDEYKAALSYYKTFELKREKHVTPEQIETLCHEVEQKKEECSKTLQEMPIIKTAVIALYDDLLDTLKPQRQALVPNEVRDSSSYLKDSQAVSLSSDDEFLGGTWFATWRYIGSYSDVAGEVTAIRKVTQGYVRLLETVQRRIKEISLGQEPVANELAGHNAILEGLEQSIHNEIAKLKARDVSHSINAARHYAAQQLEKGRDIRTHLQLLEKLINPNFRPYSIALGRLIAYLDHKDPLTSPDAIKRLSTAVEAAYAFQPVDQPLSKTMHKMIDETIAKVGPRTLQLIAEEPEQSLLMKNMLGYVAFGKGSKDDNVLKQAQDKDYGKEFTDLLNLYKASLP